MLESLALRSKNIFRATANATETSRSLFDDSEHSTSLRAVATKMEKLLDMNNGLESYFKKIDDEVSKLQSMEELLNHLGEIDPLVG